jgi:hypothetical protein
MPFPFRDPATSFVSQWPLASQIGMFLVTNFLEHRVVAARSRTQAGGQYAALTRPMLLFDSPNTIPFPRCSHAVTLLRPFYEPVVKAYSWLGMGTAWEPQGIYESNTATLCNSNGKSQSKPLRERQGTGTAGERQRNGRVKEGERHGIGMVCVNPYLYLPGSR